MLMASCPTARLPDLLGELGTARLGAKQPRSQAHTILAHLHGPVVANPQKKHIHVAIVLNVFLVCHLTFYSQLC